MIVDTNIFKEMIPAFDALKEGLENLTFSEAQRLSANLSETVEAFELMPDGPFDILKPYTPAQRKLLIENLEELAKVARAGANEEKRNTELLQAVGAVADEKQINQECNLAASNLTRILLEIPSDLNGDH